jgi:hypothetical protein
MTNRRNSAPSPNEPENTKRYLIDTITGWVVAVLLNFGTTFAICTATAKLFDDYVGQRFRHGLDAGVGIVFIYLFGFPILFVITVVLWLMFGMQHRELVAATTKWAIALSLGLAIGYTIVLIISLNWRTDSYEAFVHNQGIIALGFPSFALMTYGCILARLRPALRR